MVGAERFELPTPWSQTRCATGLRYAPTNKLESSFIYNLIYKAIVFSSIDNILYQSPHIHDMDALPSSCVIPDGRAKGSGDLRILFSHASHYRNKITHYKDYFLLKLEIKLI